MRELGNDPKQLRELRTRYRVRAPNFARHKLIRTSRRELGLPVYFFKKPPWKVDSGDAPTDTFYSNRSIFSGPISQKLSEKNSLWHDLCHAMVAEKNDKLHLDNFYSSMNEEDVSCRIEFWLGLVSGYYSPDYLVKLIYEYNYSSALATTTQAYRRVPKIRWITIGSFISFMKECRGIAIEIPVACKVAKGLRIYSQSHLVQCCRRIGAVSES